MVRKRSRTSRKHYDSDDNETDSDFSLDDTPAEPAPKKYSLRQRKRSLFLADYEYEDDEDIPPPKHESDEDEDFEVEAEVMPDEAQNSNIPYINHIEPESMPDDPDELIDFEDMIRADIVVNKNRIDYDNIITKTEIKLQPSSNKPAVPPPAKKRGRKPKARPQREYECDLIGHIYEPETEVQEEGSDYELPVRTRRERKPKVRPDTEVDSSILEAEMDVQEEYDDANDKDYDPNDDIDEENRLLTCVQAEIEEVNTPVARLVKSNIQPNLPVKNLEPEPVKIPEQETGKTVENETVEILDDENSEKENSNKKIDNDSNKNKSVKEDPKIDASLQLENSIEQISESNEEIEKDKGKLVMPALPEVTCTLKHPPNSVIKFSDKQTVEPTSKINGSTSRSRYQLGQPEVQLELKEEIKDDSDDDDVVLIEEKSTEVIVLDD